VDRSDAGSSDFPAYLTKGKLMPEWGLNPGKAVEAFFGDKGMSFGGLRSSLIVWGDPGYPV